MLEPRDACSKVNVTAQNLYHNYLGLKKEPGAEARVVGVRQRGQRGCSSQKGVSTTGEAVHPYRLVTGILSGCSRRTLHSGYTRTLPVFPSTTTSSSTHPVATFAPNISCMPPTEGTSLLLASMREKIAPVRGHMAAQRAGVGLDEGWLGARSFVLYPSASEHRWDYLHLAAAQPSY